VNDHKPFELGLHDLVYPWMPVPCFCLNSAENSRLSLHPNQLAGRKPTAMALTPITPSLWGMEYSVHGMWADTAYVPSGTPSGSSTGGSSTGGSSSIGYFSLTVAEGQPMLQQERRVSAPDFQHNILPPLHAGSVTKQHRLQAFSYQQHHTLLAAVQFLQSLQLPACQQSTLHN
jgi:hypothetical protein